MYRRLIQPVQEPPAIGAKSAFLQTATAAHTSGPIYETFLCSGSLNWSLALALIGPILDTLVKSTIFDGTN